MECDAEQLLPIGFVADFATIKAALDEWDHRFLLWDEDEFWQEFGVGGWAGHGGVIPDIIDAYGLVNVPFNPTAENLAAAAAEKLLILPNLMRVSVELWETPKASAYAERWA